MLTISRTASGLATHLARELNLEQSDAETIRFGTEIILGILIKGIVITALAYWLEIFPYVMVALVTYSMLRLVSGGVHCNTYARCLVLGTTMVMFIGYLAREIGHQVNQNTILVLTLLAAFTGIYFIQKWAPADNANKPIQREDKRQKFKRLSLLYIFIWTIFLVLFVLVHGEKSSTLSLALASIGGFLIQVFSVCPGGYRSVGTLDYLLSKLLP